MKFICNKCETPCKLETVESIEPMYCPFSSDSDTEWIKSKECEE